MKTEKDRLAEQLSTQEQKLQGFNSENERLADETVSLEQDKIKLAEKIKEFTAAVENKSN